MKSKLVKESLNEEWDVEPITPGETAFLEAHETRGNYDKRKEQYNEMYDYFNSLGFSAEEDDDVLKVYRKLDDEGKKKCLAWMGVRDINPYKNL